MMKLVRLQLNSNVLQANIAAMLLPSATIPFHARQYLLRYAWITIMINAFLAQELGFVGLDNMAVLSKNYFNEFNV